jgi:hypothetical protein
VRKLLFLVVIVLGCGDDETGTGGGTSASSTTGMTVGPPSLEASITCGGAPVQLSCPSGAATFMTSIGPAGELSVYCLGTDMLTSINIIVPSPAVGNLRDLGRKYNIAINCPDGSVQSITEAGGGAITIESIDPDVQIKGSFQSDVQGAASGTFLAVKQSP